MIETKLTAVLKSHGLRLTDFAKKAKVHKATATRWSQNGVPLKKLEHVSKRTGIPVKELRPDLAKMFGGSQ